MAVTNDVANIMSHRRSVEELRAVRNKLNAVISLEANPELEQLRDLVEDALLDRIRATRHAREARRTRAALEVIADALAAPGRDGTA